MIRLVIALIGLAACTPAVEAPLVELRGDLTVEIEDAAAVWAPLGFRFTTLVVDQPTCSRRWHEDGTDPLACVIRIDVVREDNLLARYGAAGLADREGRIVYLDTLAYWTDRYDMPWLAAHEIGHVLLDAGHISGAAAVMNPDDRSRTPTDADLELACETIGACR